MEQLPAIVIEDEPNAREYLLSIIANHLPYLKVISTLDNVPDAIAQLNILSPKIVFMDIELKKGSAFDVLEQVDADEFQIIFTTAYERYAIKAFKYSALDYLLKPIDIEQLKNAVAKALKNIHNNQFNNDRIDVLRSNLNDTIQKIAIPTIEGYTFVPLNEIIWCGADGSYTKINCTDKKMILSAKILKYYEELLDPNTFCRVNKSSIANLTYVKEYTRAKKPYITLEDGTSFMVSPSRKQEILARLNLRA